MLWGMWGGLGFLWGFALCLQYNSNFGIMFIERVEMNKKQRNVILIGCVLIAGMTLFPPYRGVDLHTGGPSNDFYISKGHTEYPQRDALTRFVGHRFIYTPPSPEAVYEKLYGVSPKKNKYFKSREYTSHLDIERLSAQIVAVVLVTFGLAVAFKPKNKSEGIPQ
jgi:hypothetical protein